MPTSLVLLDVNGMRAGPRGAWLDRAGTPHPETLLEPDLTLGALEAQAAVA